MTKVNNLKIFANFTHVQKQDDKGGRVEFCKEPGEYRQENSTSVFYHSIKLNFMFTT